MRVAIAVFASALAFVLFTPTALAAPLEWEPCSSIPGASSSECGAAQLRVPMVYDKASNARNNATLPLTMHRRVVTAATTPTVIVVSEMTDSDTPTIQSWMERLTDRAAVNVYFASTRLHGWSFSNPNQSIEGQGVEPMPCGYLAIGAGAGIAIDDDIAKVVGNCHDWLRMTFGGLGTRVYALEAAAKDLARQIQAVQEESHPSNVFVLALGRASRVVQTYMALERPSTPLAGFVFDSPHALQYTSTFDAVSGASTSRFLDGCDTDAVCARNFAALGLSLRDVVNKLLLPLDKKTLKRSASACMPSLLAVALDETRDLAPSHAVRRFLATIRRHPSLAKVLPVALYRLYRCHEEDAMLLNRLWEKLNGVASADGNLNSGFATAHSDFIEQVVAFSDVWPSEVPTWQQLVRAFESSPTGDGLMTRLQPSFCLYSGNASPACAEMYEKTRKVNTSLVLTYPRGPNATLAAAATATGDVLILASRLSTVGSDAVASQLYDAFTANGQAATKLLVETDTLEEAELHIGATYMDQTGVLVMDSDTDNVGATAAFQVLGWFIDGKLRTASGKWHMSDLVADATTATKLPATLTSTYGKAPVALNLTLSPEELQYWFLADHLDPYASHLTVAVSGHGLSVWHVALLVVTGVIVLLAAACVMRVARNKRTHKAVQKCQLRTPVEPGTTADEMDSQRSVYARARSGIDVI